MNVDRGLKRLAVLFGGAGYAFALIWLLALGGINAIGEAGGWYNLTQLIVLPIVGGLAAWGAGQVIAWVVRGFREGGD